MTPAELDHLSRYPYFPASARMLISLFGLEAAAQLITAWPGQSFPVPARIGGHLPAGKRRYAQLVRVVGDRIAGKIVAYCGGADLDVPSCKDALHQWTQDKIRTRYDELIRAGHSSPEAVFELGLEFRMSGKTIERIVGRPAPELLPATQGSLF